MRGEERERGVVRLARSGKKGILRLVFSRLLIVAVLMAVQIMLYLSLLEWFQQYLPHYALLQALFVFGMAVYLFNSGMDSSAKLTWLALIAVAPLLGAALLAFTQSNLGHQATKQRTAELIAQSKDLIAQNQETLERLKGDSYAIGDLRNYLCRSGNFPMKAFAPLM